MIDVYGYRDTVESSTPKDVILNSLNRLNIGKQTGALKSTEFPLLLVHTGDLVANAARIGKINEETVDTVESDYISQFKGENANNYFDQNYEGLQEAAITFIEGDAIALQAAEERLEGFTHTKKLN